MIKKIGLLSLLPLFLLLVIAACTGLPAFMSGSARTEPESSASFFNSMPGGNGLVFIGVAGKRSNHNETVQIALEDAARRVAIFYNVYAEYALVNNIGSGAFDYVHSVHTALDYDRDGSVQYVDSLQFDADADTIEIENTFIIRATYPSSLPVPLQYRPTHGRGDKKPGWVDTPPVDIPGYEVGIGYSGRHSSLADACANSYHNAIFAIIRNNNAASSSSELLYQNTGNLFGYRTSSDNLVYSYGTLAGFYALDMWINPKTKEVWTLAVAQKPN
jgi:hypothetical protein